MPAAKPNVFNIPASAPFLPALIGALRAGRLVRGFPAGDDPLALASATLYLPTRRACRLARDVFLDTLAGDAAILPRIVALGDLDEDEIAFADAATAELADTALKLPETLQPLERRLLLAQLIMAWAERIEPDRGAPLIANTPAAAVALADDLARLMDDMITRDVSWEKLDDLVPDAYDKYWQLSLGFLKIARSYWPDRLKELGVIEAAEHRDKLIDAEAKRLADSQAPVIAAGSTGSMPATAKLLATIATLPHGAVVLPGLDTDLDEASWRLIAGNDADKTHDGLPAAGHAQFAMHALLDRIGITRGDVTALVPAKPYGREALVSEALRPAATTENWRQRRDNKDFDAAADNALATLSLIEAANAEEEALAIAASLREALETPGKTAALVTPDRALARRVVAALGRWNVAVDDSGGDALADTSAGVFARLTAQVALHGLEPVPLLALLKHPLLRLDAGKHGNAGPIATIEHALLRGPRPRPGSDGLDRAFAAFRLNRDQLHHSDTRWLIADDRFDITAEFITRLGAALSPLEALKKPHPLAELARHHQDVIAALSREPDGAIAAFAGQDGTALSDALEGLIDSPSAADLAVAPTDYAELFHAAIGNRVVRRPETRDVRVHIYGPLEARLQNIDRVVLGGLNEGTWPPETRSDPWLSRPMRRDLGLDPPERRIGLSAHDFAQSLGAPEVILRARGKSGRRADGVLALRAAHRRARRRSLERRAQARRRLSCAGARARCAGRGEACRPSGAQAAARCAAGQTVRHGHRRLAARSLHDLRQIHPAPAAARRHRHATGCARSRHRHPRRHRRLHQTIRQQVASRSDEGTAQRSASSVLPRSPITRRRAPSGGRVSCVLPIGSRAGTWIAAPASRRCMRKSKVS